VEGERLEGELAGLKAQLETLEREGVEGGRRGSEGDGDEVLYVVVLWFGLGGLWLLTLRFF
jgi:kinetochore protein Spc24